MIGKKLSRADKVDVDLCITLFNNNKFDLIVTAARRARQLQKHCDHFGPIVTPIDALLEVQEGRLTPSDNKSHVLSFGPSGKNIT
jgi:DNA-directed RNA polymerase omega subunit